MITRAQKSRATQFIAERLEQSEFYEILNRDERSVLIREKEADEPRQIKIVIPNFIGSIGAFQQGCRTYRELGIYVAPIFYKDGKTAFVRMVERNLSWRTEKSLKNYSPQEINQMLHLRGIEKAVMGRWGDELAYYQPETTNLEESIRIIELGAVELDYSHIEADHQAYGFVRDRESIDYKLPKEIESITGAARVRFAERQPDHYRQSWLAVEGHDISFPGT